MIDVSLAVPPTWLSSNRCDFHALYFRHQPIIRHCPELSPCIERTLLRSPSSQAAGPLPLSPRARHASASLLRTRKFVDLLGLSCCLPQRYGNCRLRTSPRRPRHSPAARPSRFIG